MSILGRFPYLKSEVTRRFVFLHVLEIRESRGETTGLYLYVRADVISLLQTLRIKLNKFNSIY